MAANIICANVLIEGENIDLGTSNIFQPHVRIVQESGAGPIIIGNSNIFEECVTITNSSLNTMHIGSNNLFNTGSVVQAEFIGDNCIISPKAIIGSGSLIQSDCVIGPKCTVPSNQNISQGTLIYGKDHISRKMAQSSGSVASLQSKHIDYLVQVLPKYHQIRK
ncbi:hypothetical protein BASA61_003788 [Batrachochytrium salamandrivorans]|nr:hypothetical protein BASA61_003788 [Batrachochytrium salamandrivorans]KAH9274210.1 hypothetical protein BASA83_003517 [Batrachochytrium salamandrivorans]